MREQQQAIGSRHTDVRTESTRDKMPYPNWNPPWLPGWLYAPTNGAIPNIFTPQNYENPELAYQGGLLWPFIKNVKVYRCPLDQTNTVNFRARANKLSTYVQNGALCGRRFEPRWEYLRPKPVPPGRLHDVGTG